MMCVENPEELREPKPLPVDFDTTNPARFNAATTRAVVTIRASAVGSVGSVVPICLPPSSPGGRRAPVGRGGDAKRHDAPAPRKFPDRVYDHVRHGHREIHTQPINK